MCGGHTGRSANGVRLWAFPGRPNFGHYVAAYNIAGFDDPEHFKGDMDQWLQMMKSTKPAPGHDRVLVAGQPEAEMEVIRRAEGVPLHPEVVDWFHDTCGELGVNCAF